MSEVVVPDAVGSVELLAEQVGVLVKRLPASLAELDDIDTVNDMRARFIAVEQYIAGRADAGPARAGARLCEMRIGELLGPATPGRPSGKVERVQPLLGLDKADVSRFRSMARNPDVVMEHLTESRTEVLRQVKRATLKTRDVEARSVVIADAADTHGDGWQMLSGDFRVRANSIEGGSVDLIVTDPPYPAESLPLWSDLAKTAAGLLRPQGILLALTGKIALADVMARLGEHLAYGWMYCQPLPGSSTRILARHVAQAWKPWLAFSNGPWPSGRVDWHPDLLEADPRDKDRYHWQQQTGPAAQLIDRLCPENGIVVDPFAGSGTYGVAARLVGRQFVGIELDAGRHAEATKRLGP